jgi:pyrimidine-specific ribonucleoside hydrolase
MTLSRALAFLLLLPTFASAAPKPVILDVDPGIDDALAILLAVRSPELDVRAVTVVFGNVELELGVSNALRILELAGRSDIPVGRGEESPLVAEPLTAKNVHGENGLGNVTLPEPRTKPYPGGAVRLIAETLAASPEPVTLVPVGPLTNVALFLKVHPELRPKIREIVSMGGSAAAPGTVRATVSFNILNDPEAAAIVYRSGIPVTMVGLDVTSRTVLTPERLSSFAGSSDAVERFVEAVVAFHRNARGASGVVVHDPLAVGAVIDPSFVTTELLPVDVELRGELTRGQMVVDRRVDATWRTGAPRATRVALDVDAERFLDFLLLRLEARKPPRIPSPPS